jgi:hypothetical protein
MDYLQQITDWIDEHCRGSYHWIRRKAPNGDAILAYYFSSESWAESQGLYLIPEGTDLSEVLSRLEESDPESGDFDWEFGLGAYSLSA